MDAELTGRSVLYVLSGLSLSASNSCGGKWASIKTRDNR